MNCQNKNLNRSMALISSIFIMAFFVFVNYTNASTGTLSIGEDEDGVTGACTGRHWYQSFTPTSDWAITQFDLKARMLSIANDGIITYQICEDSTCASSLYTEIVIFSATSSDFAWEEHEIPIGYNPILASGTTYYLHVEGESTCPNTSWSCKVDYANPYSGGRAWSSVNDDQFVKIYYDTDIASYQPPPDYDWTSDWFDLDGNWPSPRIITPVTTVCFTSDIDSYCPLEYFYNNKADGMELYFIYDNGQAIRPYNAATSTITPSTNNFSSDQSAFIYVPSQDTATNTPYCISYGEYGEGDEYVMCGHTIQWVTGDYFPEMPSGFCSTSTDPCADISTSTTWLGIDFGYSLECAGKRLAHWSICPTDYTYSAIQQTINRWENMFPYNIFSDFTDIFLRWSSTSSPSYIISDSYNFQMNWGTFGFDARVASQEPIILYEYSALTDYWTGFWNVFYNLMEKTLWGICGVYLLFRIYNLAKGKPKEEI